MLETTSYAIVFYHVCILSWQFSIYSPYLQARSRKLIFGRDPLGRRSLLFHKPTPEHPYLILSSVSAGIDPLYSLEELPTSGFYVLDIKQLGERSVCFLSNIVDYQVFDSGNRSFPIQKILLFCQECL